MWCISAPLSGVLRTKQDFLLTIFQTNIPYIYCTTPATVCQDRFFLTITNIYAIIYNQGDDIYV